MQKQSFPHLFLCGAFMAALFLPLIFVDLRPDGSSKAENRNLAKMPQIYKDGKLNEDYISDFETWFNDRIGFRDALVNANGTLQYYLFDRMVPSTDIVLGNHYEFNYIGEGILDDILRKNLKSDDSVTEITDSIVWLNDFFKARGIPMVYMQCWDKHSIYPEELPDTIHVQDGLSKTRTVLTELEKSDVPVSDAWDDLYSSKEKWAVYPRNSDSTHWSSRGAYIGYLNLMETLNQILADPVKVLDESDYEIETKDTGKTYFDSIHIKDENELLKVKSPEAFKSETMKFSRDENRTFNGTLYENPNAGNDMKVLLFADSYIRNYIEDDLAESFSQMLSIHSENTQWLGDVLTQYSPDLIIFENAERVDRFYMFPRLKSRFERQTINLEEPFLFDQDNSNRADAVIDQNISKENGVYSLKAGSSGSLVFILPEQCPKSFIVSAEFETAEGKSARIRISSQDQSTAQSFTESGSLSLQLNKNKTGFIQIDIDNLSGSESKAVFLKSITVSPD